jgi:proteasome lid subunit RPN8/RPN11
MSEVLTLNQAQWTQMRDQMQAALPEEACGLLSGRDARVEMVYPLENAAHSPTRFVIDPREQVEAMLAMEAAGQELLAVYHSHPLGPLHPSGTDIREAGYLGIAHLIWSRQDEEWQCRAFLIGNDAYHAIALKLETQSVTSSA